MSDSHENEKLIERETVTLYKTDTQVCESDFCGVCHHDTVSILDKHHFIALAYAQLFTNVNRKGDLSPACDFRNFHRIPPHLALR